MTQQTVSINTGDEGNKGPSIEDQYKALVAEGLISDDGDTPGDNPGETTSQEKPDAKTEGSNDERPDWLPAKFKSVEDFVKSHSELEKKLGSGKKEAPVAETPTAKPTDAETKAAAEATKKAGLDLSAVSKEYLDEGGLTDDTYAKLADAGYPKDMVDIYIEGLSSRLNATTNAAYEIVGGQDKYGEMIDWAIANLDEDEQGAFDAAVNSNNTATVKMAIKGLKATMDAAVKANASEEPQETISKGGKVPTTTYESIDDYMADLNDPRYDANETFRKQVMAKLDRSSIM